MPRPSNRPEEIDREPKTIECEVVDGQARIRNLLPQPLDLTIQDTPEEQLKHCLEHDTKAYNELIATTFEAHRRCHTYETQFKAAELIMNLLTKRREMLLQPTKHESKNKGPKALAYDPQDKSEQSGVSGLN
jgi:hypothetical protein